MGGSAQLQAHCCIAPFTAVLDCTGSGTISNTVAGLDWVAGGAGRRTAALLGGADLDAAPAWALIRFHLHTHIQTLNALPLCPRHAVQPTTRAPRWPRCR